jgi:cytochrome c2
MTRRSWLGLICATVAVALWTASLATSAAAADDDADDYPPGLVAKYFSPAQNGQPARRFERVDADLQFAWHTASPDSRILPKEFEVLWTGKLLVRAEGKYRLHLYVLGAASVVVDGRTVVEGERDSVGWLDGAETQLDFGERDVVVTFRKTQPQATVRLFWSARDSFPIEPIPPQVLFHDEARTDLKRLERGGELFSSLRCNRCHVREHDLPSPPGPDLARVATDLNRDWLVQWLQRSRAHALPEAARHAERDGYVMPSFGFTNDEATAVAAFLIEQSLREKPKPVLEKEPPRDADVRPGELLFRSVGCLACHTHGDIGQSQSHFGGDLTQVGGKRSAAWLEAWLKDPSKLNRDHRMPVVKLADTERRQVVAYLSRIVTAKVSPPAEAGAGGRVASGRELVEAARCAACHRIPGIDSPREGIAKSLAEPVRDFENSCLSRERAGGSLRSTPATPRRPTYTLSDDDRAALRAFVESRYGPLSAESPFEIGGRLLRERNCLACHERNGSRGITPIAGAVAKLDVDLPGQSEALIPPDLTAVGDKLHDKALAVAIRGEQPTVRMPWLRVRMPRFAHTADETAALQAYLIGHDRIPARPQEAGTDGKPDPTSLVVPPPADEPQRRSLIAAGRNLVGPQGWSCTACHRVGEFEPRNVALGTRGSNLHRIGDRMRPEYFLRWTRSPLRIIPGMEMPSYERPVAGILGAHVPKQLGAVWEALNDAVSPVSADVANVEQIVTVSPGQPARIIRDVFRLPPQPTPNLKGGALTPGPSPPKGEGSRRSEFVPRAFAVGLNNGANILFDLDTMSLRQYWVGELARQRPSGKSWFWIPGAPSHWSASESEPDVALFRQGAKITDATQRIVAKREFGQSGRLIGYGPKDDGVRLTYRLRFDIDGREVAIDVTQQWKPGQSERASHPTVWVRRIIVDPIPDGFIAVRVRRQNQTVLAEPFESGVVTTQFHLTRLNAANTTEEAAAVPPVHSPALLERLDCVPGFEVVRLPLDHGIMPTAITHLADGTMMVCSLKGHVYAVKDSDGDGVEDKLVLFEEGLAAPYGIIADTNGRDVIVAHKPELLRLRDTDRDGRADVREVFVTGWGYSDDYHDWTFGIVRDSRGRLYIGLGSDYANKGRPTEISRWRGTVLRVDPAGQITPMGHAFRYPTGLAITADDQVFVSDNQGVGNTFNEINHLVEGAHYGVPALHDEKSDQPPRDPAIKVPHPWTRSVNGIFFWRTNTSPSPPKGERGPGGEGQVTPDSIPKQSTGTNAPHPQPLSPFGGEGSLPHPFAGHGIGCEYDTKALVRFTLQPVGDKFQGAVYPFSTADSGALLGSLSGGVAPNGDIYIGCIHDSGWLGGRNVGEIVRLRALGADKLPLGIRELRATRNGMVIDFTGSIDRAAGSRIENYAISGYTRKWEGAYATPDSGRHKVEIKSVEVATDDRQVTLTVDRWQPGFVYEVTCSRIGHDSQAALWPAVGHYTMNVVPRDEQKETKGTKK